MDDLSDEQRAVLDDIFAGRNIFVTGAAGTGKSHLLRRIREILNEKRIPFGLAGSTGVSAVNIGGSTLHSWCGIGLGTGPVSNLVQNIRNNKNAFRRIAKSDILFLDEVSMISGELFEKIDKVFRMVREQDVPFGGMQIVMFGDMLQLPPVEGKFVFETPLWDQCGIAVHMLTKVFRQDDLEFSTALGMLRMGRLDEPTKAFFNKRFTAVDPNPEVPPVSIVAKNETADAINRKELDSLEGELVTYEAEDTGNDTALRLLEKCLIPKTLHIKIGARVMCLINFADLGIMNGSTGYVTGYVSGLPEVLFDNGVQVVMENVEKEVVQDGKTIGSRTQIPMRLAWAISTHKSQGTTLDKIKVILGEAWEPSQCYVALSRVRTVDGLFIDSLNRAALKPNARALAFYEKHKKLDQYDRCPLL